MGFYMLNRLAAAFVAATLPLASPVFAQELTPEEVKRLALEAILENPGIVMEAVEILRAQEEAEQIAATQAAIAQMQVELLNDPNAPVMGNPEGDVTVVEFFDYNCPYCKQAASEVKTLIEADPNVRVLYREWPILGEGSLFAARAALAAREQGMYDAFHWALMEDRTRKDASAVLRIAGEVGLDLDKLQADMEAEAVTAHIEQSNTLARDLGFSGTPAFVIGDQGIFGVATADQMAEAIALARSASAVDGTGTLTE